MPRLSAVNDERGKYDASSSLQNRHVPPATEPRSGRLFVLDLSGNRVFSVNPDGSDRKVIVTRVPDA